MYKLVIEDDEGKKTVVPLIRDEITIGRKEGNTIRLTERNVSRRHAKLIRNNGAVFIEDLESYNGIRVNGAKIDGRVAVAEGDRIQIGDYMLGLQAEGTDERPAVGADGGAGAAAQRSPAQQGAAPSDAEASATAASTGDENQTEGARLVCVSSNFAGLEALLNKPVVVIGRTADNDIVINHRSISRHHAQIVEENGRYTVMDMQSVNGVRVNGEEYGKVELRRGDLIDLGHVRLRFIAPGEKFNFATDATIFDMSQPEQSRSGLWLALALVALAGVGFAVWKFVLQPAAQLPDEADGMTTQVSEETEPTENTPSGRPKRDARELIRHIVEAANAYEWKQAIELCEELSEEDRPKAENDCARVAGELDNKSWFDKAVAAELRNEHKDAIIAFRKIPAESVYYAQVQRSDVFAQAARNYEAEMSLKIDKAVKEKDCEQAENLADELSNLLPDEATAIAERAQKCAAKQQRATHDKRRPPRGTKATKAATAQTGPTPSQIEEAKSTLDQAWKAYREGYYTLASSLARKVLKTMPNQQALSIVGASACYLKRPKQAQDAYKRLDAQRRQLLRRVCQRMGVPIN